MFSISGSMTSCLQLKITEDDAECVKYYNWSHTQKSTLVPLSGDAWDPTAHKIFLPICTGNITYLGINISPKLSELFNLNYTPLLKKIEDDLKRWINLLLSLMGCIPTVKMKTLPQINYLFTMLPITPTDKWFK